MSGSVISVKTHENLFWHLAFLYLKPYLWFLVFNLYIYGQKHLKYNLLIQLTYCCETTVAIA